MRVKVVTSMSEHLYLKYGKDCLATWVENLKLDVGSLVEIWINGPFPRNLPTLLKCGTPIVYKSLDTQSQAWVYFFNRFNQVRGPQGVPSGQEYKFKFLPFSCKVYALAEAALPLTFSNQHPGQTFDALAWIDLDVKVTKEVTSEFFHDTLGIATFAWLDRGAPWNHGETGFMVAKATEETLELFLQVANVYGSGQLFFFNEWHDAAIYTATIRLKEFMEGNKFIVKNLNEDMASQHQQGLQPFETSVLKDFFVHFKGNRKEEVVAKS